MIAVVRDASGKIKETRETWRKEDGGLDDGVKQETVVRQNPSDNLQDPNDAPHRKDGSLRPHPGPKHEIPGEGTPGAGGPDNAT